MAFPLQVTISSLSLVSFKYAHECEQLGFGVCLEFMPKSVWQDVAYVFWLCVILHPCGTQCCLILG